MSNETISTTYNGIVITYDERADKWLYTPRNRDRSAKSLELAKKAIDAPPPKEEKPFERIQAYTGGRPSYPSLHGHGPF